MSLRDLQNEVEKFEKERGILPPSPLKTLKNKKAFEHDPWATRASPDKLEGCMHYLDLLLHPEEFEPTSLSKEQIMATIREFASALNMNYKGAFVSNAVWELCKSELYDEALQLIELLDASDPFDLLRKIHCLGKLGLEQNIHGKKREKTLSELRIIKEDLMRAHRTKICIDCCLAISVTVHGVPEKKEAIAEAKSLVKDAHDSINIAQYEIRAGFLEDARMTLKSCQIAKVDLFYTEAMKKLAEACAKEQKFKDAFEIATELFGRDRLFEYLALLKIESEHFLPEQHSLSSAPIIDA